MVARPVVSPRGITHEAATHKLAGAKLPRARARVIAESAQGHLDLDRPVSLRRNKTVHAEQAHNAWLT